jgi:hypothetical protein
VTFYVCAKGTGPCSSGGSLVGSPVPLLEGANDDSMATSEGFTPSEGAGTYCLRAEYSGDANYNAASDASADECFTVAAAPPQCTTAIGHGVYKKVGEPGRLKLKDSLSTELAAPQTLNVKYESGKVHFRLLKLETATCTGEPGERDFHGEGSAVKNKVAGYTLSFSIYEKSGGFFFESKLMKGAKEVEASGGPLKKSTEKIS